MSDNTLEKKIDNIAASPLRFRELLQKRYQDELEKKPHCQDLKWNLAETLRALGRFEQASDIYSSILEADPGHDKARYMNSILCGDYSIPQQNQRLNPTPFRLKRNFLPDSDNLAILDKTIEKKGSFNEATVGARSSNALDTTIRSTQILKNSALGSLLDGLREKINEEIPQWKLHFNLQDSKTGSIEMSILRYGHGQFYHVHKDKGLEETSTRLITFVYFFHKEPKVFSGGELLLYDTDNHTGTSGSGFSGIHPINNSLVVFPSHCFHQVTPVINTANTFDSARFAINGFVHLVQ